MSKLPDLTALADGWPPIIPATELSRLLGGLYTSKTLGNLRWMGKGPRAFRLGRKVVHQRQDVIEWLQAEMRPIDPDGAS